MFLVVALSSSDGTSAGAAVLFAVIAGGDYLDGILARVTGQYSRLGTLLDPITDRVLIVAGVVVCWHFHLLPRWALAVLAARELLMLGSDATGSAGGGAAHQLARPVAVFPLMAVAVFAMTGLEDLGGDPPLRRPRAGHHGDA